MMTDVELNEIVTAAQRGDEPAFEELVRRSEQFVFGLIARHASRVEAETIAQDVFVAVFQGLSALRDTGAYWGWLRGVTLRKCADWMRGQYRSRERPITRLSAEDRGVMDRWIQKVAIEAFTDAESRKAAESILEHVLGALSADDRMVVQLTELEGASVAETAELLGWSRAATKVRAFRARKKLKQALASLYGV